MGRWVGGFGRSVGRSVMRIICCVILLDSAHPLLLIYRADDTPVPYHRIIDTLIAGDTCVEHMYRTIDSYIPADIYIVRYGYVYRTVDAFAVLSALCVCFAHIYTTRRTVLKI